jgi:hypothetical protein
MDREVGDVISQLMKDGLLDNTIIIFYSDHGGPLPRGKREVLESGTLVPFMVRFPHKKGAGTVVEDLCSFVDIPATILSLAGVDIPDYMHGQAFLGDQKANSREHIFSARDRMDEWFDCRRAVRDGRFRYIRNYRPDLGAYLDLEFRRSMNTMQELLGSRDNGSLTEDQAYWFRTEKAIEELYDLENDRHELQNLAEDPEFKAIKESLGLVLDQWIEEIDDKGLKYSSEKELMFSMWPGGVQPLTDVPTIVLSEDKVEITSKTDGASLVYQINHRGIYQKHWRLYSNPLQVEPGDTITAIAHRIGYLESDPAEYIVAL